MTDQIGFGSRGQWQPKPLATRTSGGRLSDQFTVRVSPTGRGSFAIAPTAPSVAVVDARATRLGLRTAPAPRRRSARRDAATRTVSHDPVLGVFARVPRRNPRSVSFNARWTASEQVRMRLGSGREFARWTGFRFRSMELTPALGRTAPGGTNVQRRRE